MNNKVIGRIGENAAVQYLESKGYTIRERNFRCKVGEIDVIATKDNSISFVEVKTRQNFNYGRPCEAVTYNKQNRIRQCAQYYLKGLERNGLRHISVKFEVIEIVIRHTESAF